MEPYTWALAHWNAAWPIVAAAVTLASALDAALPQPSPGSHWLPVRKALSIVALALGNASNGGQPPLSTWLLRVLKGLVPPAEAAAVLAEAQAKAPPPVASAPGNVVNH